MRGDCPMIPSFSNIYIDAAAKVRETVRNLILNIILFADNKVLMAKMEDILQTAIRKYNVKCTSVTTYRVWVGNWIY
jgi:hypothetical protein